MKLTTVHPDWYEDGIEDRENCFRLDFFHDSYPAGALQAQVFLKVKKDNDDPSKVEYGKKCRVFIERDARQSSRPGSDNGDVRIDYASDARRVSPEVAAELLAGDTAAFVAREKVLIERVLALPREAEYCDK